MCVVQNQQLLTAETLHKSNVDDADNDDDDDDDDDDDLQYDVNFYITLLHQYHNFYCATLCVSAVFAISWCLSVCLSPSCIVSRYRQTSFSAWQPHDLVFGPKCRYPIPRGTPPVGAQNTWGRWEKFVFSTEIAVYLGNDTRQAHSCHGTLIGSHGWRIDT